MKKTFKKIIAMAMTAVMLFGMSTGVFAEEVTLQENDVQINDVITNDDNQQEKVITVNEDGSFVTIPLNHETKFGARACSHTQLEAYGSILSTSQSYNKNSASYCYKTRTMQNALCLSCGMSGIKIYTAWVNHGHDYPLFSSTCRECGYKK